MPFPQVQRLTAFYTVLNGRNIFSNKVIRSFHSSRPLCEDDVGQNHYETLKVGENASAAEIKKCDCPMLQHFRNRSFYTLSKTHHPDHNRSDPEAPARFMRISDAYSVLSSPDKRAAYDRDVMRTRHHHHHAAAATRGSYSSTGPAGGRAASGLSRRRSTYTGPPPSFYRNGGWGAHGAKRAAAHEASSGGADGARAEQKPPPGDGTWGAGMGYGQGQRAEEVPHFDHESHERTHRRMDRRKASSMEFEPSIGSHDSFMGGFIVVSAVLAVALAVPALFFSLKRDRSDRSEAIRQRRV
ncbi:hypothetical protein PpBr36_08172 [Pyricularia pennisetigena]|uniref:hypothetical protein n=1 Tax=Pyricularia pennisetigena TaxID=1578925 RepID=UPI0011530AE4|nr:hypothetical protein PpBr36_08172 [Pyricularia pennisetigena]TLS24117.1 hypothetical protein PpBr36_08172 [Pyricularia pennisetigena]